MSLVLNTNTSWWWYQLSNQDIVQSYPELNNNIIIWPTWRRRWISATPVLTVNWTSIDDFCAIVSAPDLYEVKWPINWQYSPIATACNFLSSVGQATTMTRRIWTAYPIQSWLIIWKKIIFPKLFYWNTSWNLPSSYLTSMYLKVWVLHTDWTITYIATQEIDITTRNWWNSYYFNTGTFWSNRTTSYGFYEMIWSNVLITTSWYTTQEWDYVFWERQATKKAGTSTTTMCMWDTPYLEDTWTRRSPFQISID